MKKVLVILISLCFLFNTGLFAKEWSDAQMEVLKQVEKSYDLWAKKDIEGWLSYIDEDYCGWHYESAVTQKKSNMNSSSMNLPLLRFKFWMMSQSFTTTSTSWRRMMREKKQTAKAVTQIFYERKMGNGY